MKHFFIILFLSLPLTGFSQGESGLLLSANLMSLPNPELRLEQVISRNLGLVFGAKYVYARDVQIWDSLSARQNPSFALSFGLRYYFLDENLSYGSVEAPSGVYGHLYAYYEKGSVAFNGASLLQGYSLQSACSFGYQRLVSISDFDIGYIGFDVGVGYRAINKLLVRFSPTGKLYELRNVTYPINIHVGVMF